MSIENFKPTLWRARLLSNLKKAHVYGEVASTEYNGQITSVGDTVKINAIGSISVSDYSGSVSFEELEDASTKLQITEDKYVAFKVDDVDQLQSNANEMDEAMNEASYSLSDESDVFLSNLYSDAGISISESSFDSVLVTDFFAEMHRKLGENDVPKDMPKWAILPPWVIKKMVLADIDFNTDNSETLEQGWLDNYMGFNVYMSNNVPNDGSDDDPTSQIMAGTPRAIGFAEQMLNLEAVDLEKSFDDGIKGRYVYGGKVIRPAELINAELDFASE